jgi:zinc finger protein
MNDVICPFCGKKKLKLNELLYELPVVGRAYIYSYVCEECGFVKRDVQLIDVKEPRRFIFTVETPKDLYTKIVRAPTGKITLKEVGVEIIPGIIAEMFITNVEGLILRVLDILETAQRFQEQEKNEEGLKKISEIRKYLNLVLDGKQKLTIVIEDEAGNSAILSEKAKVEKIIPPQ